MAKSARLTLASLILKTISHEVACRRAERRLLELPDYMLRDLGVGRDEIYSAVRGAAGR